MEGKKKKIIKKIALICIVVIVIELLTMAIVKVIRERKINHINSLNSIIRINDGYVGVGISDFYKSDFVKQKIYEYTEPISKQKQNIITTQAKIVKYDNNMNIEWENTYDNIYDATFYDVLAVEDGYIAVGSFVNEYSQIDDDTREALIVKYDGNGKVVWKNTYKVLSDTEFYRIIEDDDSYVVIGQSIYQNMEMGNHLIGGGIIVRYNKDGEDIAHNNYGGNKSGSFNDIIKVDDGYIVCGKDAVNYGIVAKFKKDFNRYEDDTNIISKAIVWERTYSNTDTQGFTGMTMVDNNLYVVGALNVSNDKDSEGNTIFKYNAGVVIYSKDGKYLGKYVLENDHHHRFNSITTDNKNLYMSMNLDVDTNNESGKQSSMLLKYSIDNKTNLKLEDEYILEGDNNYIVNKIVSIDNKHMYIGTTNNTCGLLGCDYQVVALYYEDLKK